MARVWRTTAILVATVWYAVPLACSSTGSGGGCRDCEGGAGGDDPGGTDPGGADPVGTDAGTGGQAGAPDSGGSGGQAPDPVGGSAGNSAGAAGEIAGGAGGCAGTACVDPCEPNPCRNDGVCAPSGDVASCECSAGWGGPRCEHRLFAPLAPPTPNAACRALGVSADASVAVGYCGTQAVRWNAAGVATVLPARSGSARALDVNANGSTIVGWTDVSTPQRRLAAVWSGGGVPSIYPGLAVDAGSDARGVSGDGIRVVGVAVNDTAYDVAAYWDTTSARGQANAIVDIYQFNSATAVSGDGNVIVGNGVDPGAETFAFRWTEARGREVLPYYPMAMTASAHGVNRDGSVIVGGSGGQAVRWVAPARLEALGIPGVALAVSADGRVVVGRAGSGAFLWLPESGARPLRSVLTQFDAAPPNWTLAEATDVSADGSVIVGFGTMTGSALERAFIVHLPSSAVAAR